MNFDSSNEPLPDGRGSATTMRVCGGGPSRDRKGAVKSYAGLDTRSAVCLTLCIILAMPAHAWNSVGHRAVAGVAYARLTDRTRARVDQMIRAFPDYDLLVRESNAPQEERARARAVFMTAAYWSDIIKGDTRFYDDGRGTPTPTLPGFPDMERRQVWHYINGPFSTDGTPVSAAPIPNVLTQLRMILGSLGSPLTSQRDSIYFLPWLEHLVGDVHQPLHAASRFRKGQVDRDGNPMNDRGGNTVLLEGGRNLHALWDDALGITRSDEYLDKLVETMLKRAPRSPGSLRPEDWVKEGFEVAKRDVYSFGNEGGTKENPLRLPEAYMLRMRLLALERGALAGMRLAAVLNERLR